MAQQTINVGTAPNDGTGTPLRTAFQYTNSNFSELYTAVGPSGNNIVVPGNATITGDLTVDTSTLKVDSANDRVGIGTATPGYNLQVGSATYASIGTSIDSITQTSHIFKGTPDAVGYEYAKILSGRESSPFTYGSFLAFYTEGKNSGTTDTSTERYKIDSTGVATWSNVGGVAGTAMTLNSTGLGVGNTPNANFKATFTGLYGIRIESASSNNSVINIGCDTASGYAFIDTSKTGSGSFLPLRFATSDTERMRIDTSGNVGIGVTPTYKLDVSTGGVLNTTARLIGNDQSNVRLRFENTGASGRIWEFVGGLAGSNNRWFSLRDVTGSTTPWGVDDSMNVISNVTGTAPTLATNSQMVFNLTSNTNLRISVRGTDGVTRTANLTLA